MCSSHPIHVLHPSAGHQRQHQQRHVQPPIPQGPQGATQAPEARHVVADELQPGHSRAPAREQHSQDSHNGAARAQALENQRHVGGLLEMETGLDLEELRPKNWEDFWTCETCMDGCLEADGIINNELGSCPDMFSRSVRKKRVTWPKNWGDFDLSTERNKISVEFSPNMKLREQKPLANLGASPNLP